jgi:hypothetical protein
MCQGCCQGRASALASSNEPHKVNGEKNDSAESEESTFERRSPTVGGCRDTQRGFWEVKVEAQVGSGSSQLWPSSSREATQVAPMASYLFRLKRAAANQMARVFSFRCASTDCERIA